MGKGRYAVESKTPTHLGGHDRITHLDKGALDYLVGRFRIRSMLDVGCGPGGMVLLARSLGLSADGVDGDPAVREFLPDVIQHDFIKGPMIRRLSYGESYKWDLAWSVEFLEHVEERYLLNVFAALDRCCVVFVTHALPGVGGYHHVNCRSEAYWCNRFGLNGFVLDEEATTGCRAASTMDRDFARRTGKVFVRRG